MNTYLNICSNEELTKFLNSLDEDMYEDHDNVLSACDLKKLCADINFDEDISQSPKKSEIHPEWGIPVSEITLGDELDLNNITDDNITDILLRPSTPNNVLVDSTSFDLNLSPDLEEFLQEPSTLSTQEVNNYVKSFCESDIAEDIVQVRTM